MFPAGAAVLAVASESMLAFRITVHVRGESGRER
jgi:hypothetical protein